MNYIVVSVTPAMVEPNKGWLDNLSSPIAISGAASKGVLRVLNGSPDTLNAYVPVDISTNSLMVSTWKQSK